MRVVQGKEVAEHGCVAEHAWVAETSTSMPYSVEAHGR